ncbi:hypothetical protein AXW83_18135 [Bosea sp. PAMC 26642]|nr:hypothetical protein AXW83_18135 [Bosea sp. PAMC 26642]
MAILLAFTVDNNVLSLAQLSDITGLYKSTLLRIISSLERNEMLERRPDGRYRLGTSSIYLGTVARKAFGFGEVVQTAVAEMSETTGESSGFFVRTGSARLGIAFSNSHRQVRHQVEIGQLLPLEQGGAASRAFLAFEAGWRTAAVAALVSRSHGERDPDLAAVAAPVFGLEDKLVGVLTVSGPVNRFNDESANEYSAKLVAMVRKLSLQLGATPDCISFLNRASAHFSDNRSAE